MGKFQEEGCHRDAHLMSWQNDLHFLPQSVSSDLVCHKVLELLMQANHELSPWCDAVWVKPRLWGQCLTTITGLLFKNFCLLGWAEPGARSYFNGKGFFVYSCYCGICKCCGLTTNEKIHLSNGSSSQNIKKSPVTSHYISSLICYQNFPLSDVF
jgi:hypothetical protein